MPPGSPSGGALLYLGFFPPAGPPPLPRSLSPERLPGDPTHQPSTRSPRAGKGVASGAPQAAPLVLVSLWWVRAAGLLEDAGLGVPTRRGMRAQTCALVWVRVCALGLTGLRLTWEASPSATCCHAHPPVQTNDTSL